MDYSREYGDLIKEICEAKGLAKENNRLLNLIFAEITKPKVEQVNTDVLSVEGN